MTVSSWMIFAVVFAALFIFWKQWRAFTVSLMLTLLLTVAAPMLGAMLTLPILIVGAFISVGCLIANDEQREAFEQKFREAIRGASRDEEEQQG